MSRGYLCFFLALVLSFVRHEEAAIFVIPDGNVTALRQAITTANSNGQDDIIILAGNGTYTLQAIDNADPIYGPNGLPVIMPDNHHSITISGNGSTIRRNTAGSPPLPEFRIMQVAQDAAIQLNALTLTSGLTHAFGGGAIYSAGTLTLNSCVVSGNTAIASPGTNGSEYGGGIYNDSGGMTATDCTFSNNTATGATPPDGTSMRGGDALGGAIYYAASLTRCTFTNNTCTAGNGATANPGFFSGDGGGAAGGAVYYVLSLTDCTFSNNSCQAGAGAVAATNGHAGNGGGAGGGAVSIVVNVVDSSFTSNIAAGGTSPGQTTGGGAGGAVAMGSSGSVSGSTFTSNSATGPVFASGGAVYVVGRNMTVELRNCTLAMNSATRFGGGICGATPSGPEPGSAIINIYNCTLSGNNAPMGGGVSSSGESVIYYANTIFRLGSTGANVDGGISRGHNITDDNGGQFGQYFNGPGDMRNTNAGLITTTPGDYGGPTKTIPIGIFGSSPAINNGDPTYALRRDQRGYFRNGAPDIGAYEYFGSVIGNVTGIARTGVSLTDITVSFEAVDRLSYHLQRKLNITDASWQDINGVNELTATGNDIEPITAPGDMSLGKAFYRVTFVSGP